MTTPQATHEHQAPPEDDQTVQHIAEILAAGYAAHVTADALAHLLVPFKLPKLAILAALGLAGTGTAHRPNARLKTSGVPQVVTTGVVRKTRDGELYYRAAYVLNASRRITASVQAGQTIKQAVAAERVNTRAHEQARRNRQNVAAKMQHLARMFGPLLGWYRDPVSDSESECIDADGHNFLAAEGTVIGYPGSVHPHCHCVAGPPHENGGMVNDHVNVVVKPIAKTFKLKR